MLKKMNNNGSVIGIICVFIILIVVGSMLFPGLLENKGEEKRKDIEEFSIAIQEQIKKEMESGENEIPYIEREIRYDEVNGKQIKRKTAYKNGKMENAIEDLQSDALNMQLYKLKKGKIPLEVYDKHNGVVLINNSLDIYYIDVEKYGDIIV